MARRRATVSSAPGDGWKELILAAIFAVGGGLAIWFFAVAETMPYEAERLKEEMSFGYYLIPVVGPERFWWGSFWLTGACGTPWFRRKCPGPVHSQPASLSRGGAPGQGALCHGGPGFEAKRPVVRQTGSWQGGCWG